jgi:uncharacterized protein YlaN (UPF0358 family)
MQFHEVNLPLDKQELDPDELSKELDFAIELEVVYDEENPQRSKRNQKK